MIVSRSAIDSPSTSRATSCCCSLRDLDPVVGLVRSAAAVEQHRDALVYAGALRSIGLELELDRAVPARAEPELEDLLRACTQSVGTRAARRALRRGEEMSLADLLAYLGKHVGRLSSP